MAISYRDPFIDGWIHKGEARGEARGETRARAADIIKALEARGVETTKAQRIMITNSTDLDQLNTWFERALTATTAAEVFDG